MKSFLTRIITAVLGLWLASMFVPGAHINLLPESNFFGFGLTALWQIFLLLGIILGLLNFFVKPILDVITLPLRIITLGLFGFFIEAGLIWVLDYMFREFSAPWMYPLVLTTLIIWGLNIVGSMVARESAS